MTGDLLHVLDLRRRRAHDRAREAANPAERAEWERVADDLDAATALVRRALRVEAGIVGGVEVGPDVEVVEPDEDG